MDHHDSMIRQKLFETELGIYGPEGDELNDPRFQEALKAARRLRAPILPGQAHKGTDSVNDAMAKLCSIRHYCFVHGVLGRNPDPDFRQAFRTLNRRTWKLAGTH